MTTLSGILTAKQMNDLMFNKYDESTELLKYDVHHMMIVYT